VGNVLLKQRVEKFWAARANRRTWMPSRNWASSIKLASRCGLGQTSANPVLTTLKNFRPVYEARVKPRADKMEATFDIHKALGPAETIAARKSVIYNH
jgi:[NiFe] hydrogenase diaphorase moiety large subunit